MRITSVALFTLSVAAIVPSAAGQSALSVSGRLCVNGNPDSQSTSESNTALIGCVNNQNGTGETIINSFNSNTYATDGYSYYGFTTGYATYGKLGAEADIITVNGAPAVYTYYDGQTWHIHVAPEIATMTVTFGDQFKIATTPGLHYFQPVMTLEGGASSGIDSAYISAGKATGRLSYCSAVGTVIENCGSVYGISSGYGGYRATNQFPLPIPFNSGDTISFFASLSVEAAAGSVNDPGTGPSPGIFTGGDYDSVPQAWFSDRYTANEAATFGDTASLTGFIITDGGGQSSPFSFTAVSGIGYLAQFGSTSQTIDFGALADVVLGVTPVALTASASSVLPVIFLSTTPAVCVVSGAIVSIVAVGACSLTAVQNGNSTYAPATAVTRTFAVSEAVAIQPVAAFLDQFNAPALTFNGSTVFPDAGGLLIGAPGVAQAQNGDTYIVGLDSAGGVHLNSYSYAKSAWNGWQYSGGILDTTSGMTAAVDPFGVVWFAGRDIGNRFWINSWNGIAFGGWILLDQGIFAADSIPQIAIPSDGTIYVIGKDIGGRVWSGLYDPSVPTFYGWVDRQGVISGQPSATAGQDGQVYVVARNVATDSPVYITQIPANNAPFATTWINGGGLIDTDPQITSQDGTVYLLAEAANNTVYLLTFAESTQTFGAWSFTNGILKDSTISPAAGNIFIAGRDSENRIYWYSDTGKTWFLAGNAGINAALLTGGK